MALSGVIIMSVKASVIESLGLEGVFWFLVWSFRSSFVYLFNSRISLRFICN